MLFVSKDRACSKWRAFQGLPSKAGSSPYTQILDQAREGWRGTNTLAYFVSDEEKSFITSTPGRGYKMFFFVTNKETK